MTTEKMSIPVDTYHGHMCEAVKSLRSSFLLLRHANECRDNDPTRYQLFEDAGMQCRYAFLLAANSLEAAANSLLMELKTSSVLYQDLEKLSTLLKFEVVCMALGKKLNRGSDVYSRVKEVVRCRNEFVHPKPHMAPYGLDAHGTKSEVRVRRTKARKYPMAMEFVTPEHAKNAIGDILAFLAWVVFDTCQLGIEDGAIRLGCGSRIVTGDVTLLAEEYGFDMRTFGERGNRKQQNRAKKKGGTRGRRKRGHH